MKENGEEVLHQLAEKVDSVVVEMLARGVLIDALLAVLADKGVLGREDRAAIEKKYQELAQSRERVTEILAWLPDRGPLAALRDHSPDS